MPKYTYFCKNCEEKYDIIHSLNDTHDVCKSCGKVGYLNKIPSSFNHSKISKDRKVGELVKEYIDDYKQDINDAKEELKKRKYGN